MAVDGSVKTAVVSSTQLGCCRAFFFLSFFYLFFYNEARSAVDRMICLGPCRPVCELSWTEVSTPGCVFTLAAAANLDALTLDVKCNRISNYISAFTHMRRLSLLL